MAEEARRPFGIITIVAMLGVAAPLPLEFLFPALRDLALGVMAGVGFTYLTVLLAFRYGAPTPVELPDHADAG